MCYKACEIVLYVVENCIKNQILIQLQAFLPGTLALLCRIIPYHDRWPTTLVDDQEMSATVCSTGTTQKWLGRLFSTIDQQQFSSSFEISASKGTLTLANDHQSCQRIKQQNSSNVTVKSFCQRHILPRLSDAFALVSAICQIQIV